MAEHLETGKMGEEEARRYLAGKGYRIRETNWRFGSYEIDIIAMKGEYIVFVEVRTRRSVVFGDPEVSVDKRKQQWLIRSANAYIRRFNIDLEARFDIIAIVIHNNEFKVNHIERAFYPTL